MVASILVPSFYSAYAAGFGLLLHFVLHVQDIAVLICSCLLFGAVLLPSVSMFTIKGSELGMDIFKSLRPLLICLFVGSDAQVLVKIRQELQEYLHEVIEEYGPRAFADFDQHKIISNDMRKSKPDTTPSGLKDVMSLFMSPEEDVLKWSEVSSNEVDDIFIHQVATEQSESSEESSGAPFSDDKDLDDRSLRQRVNRGTHL